MNKFKTSVLRQFGSENISFTSEIESENETLTPEQVKAQIEQVDGIIRKAFIATQEREISEKELLAQASDRRKEEVAKLDKSLQEEMKAKANAELTQKEAIKLSERLEQIHKK